MSEKIKSSGWQQKLIFIFLTALLIRGVFVLSLQDGFYFADSVDYSAAAENLIASGEFGEGYLRGPTYPLFLAGIYGLFGEKIIWVRIVQAFVGAFLAIVIACIGRRISGEEVGALAGILWNIYPLGILISGLVYPESVATILLACGVLCMVTKPAQELGRVTVFLGGIFFGLAALTKPVALVTVVAITLWIMYWRRTHRILLATLFLLGVALSLTPWTVRNFQVYGAIVIVEATRTQHLPYVGEIQEDGDNKSEDKVEAIMANPGEYLKHFGSAFVHFWELYPQRVKMSRPAYRAKLHARDSRIVRKTIFDTSWTSLISILSVGPMFFFALIGVGAMWGDKERRCNLSLLCMIILSFAIGYSFFYARTRYRIPVEPYILILSAYGMAQVYGMLLQPAHKRVAHSPEESEAAKASPIS